MSRQSWTPAPTLNSGTQDMHEISIAEGIIDAVETTAKKHGLTHIKSVRVSIGELAGVDIDALRFAWTSVTQAGLACGAELEIERTPGQAWCVDCECNVPLVRYGDACPRCGGFHLLANAGTEMRVLDILPENENSR